ncbi:MAG: isopenicillin N synthase family oxygenase [Chlamydiia bacterium]|nr:isopenicillin N synthase family oxygenase [Chlamydiia bacterium]
MGHDKSFLPEILENGNTLLRAIHYPANPPKNQTWAAAHTDINLFTILPRATASGLQVKGKDGQWITVHVPENAFIVNGGDMLRHLSNGEFRSSVHRVISMDEGGERYSMVMFVHPRSEVDLTPRAENIARTGGEQKFASCTVWELLFERLADLGLAGPSMLQPLGESGFLERQIQIGNASPEAMLAVHQAGFASADVENYLSEQGLLHQSDK